MSSSEGLTQPRIRSMRRWLALAWSTIWVLGIGLLALVASATSDLARESAFDAELNRHATSVYAMGWFDPLGVFREGELQSEPDYTECPHELWVLSFGDDVRVHVGPEAPLTSAASLRSVGQRAIETEDVAVASIGARRALARPVYQIDLFGDQEVYGAVVVVGDGGPGRKAQRRFVGVVTATGALIGLLGIALGLFLARRSTRPLEELLDARSQFLVAAAHELKTPLAVVRAVHDAVQCGDTPSKEAWQDIDQELTRAQAGVESLMLRAKLDAGAIELDLQDVRLDLLVESVLDEEQLDSLDAAPCVVRVDQDLVKVAVLNLVRNAERYGEAGSTKLRIRGSEVQVTTRGAAFPESVLGEGSRFVPGAQGSGFGLTLTRMIAELHGGTLLLENPAEGGTRSLLRLPGVSQS